MVDFRPHRDLGLAASADVLIAKARRHDLGLDFIVQGHPEAVAITHGVHADVVHEARLHLARDGHTADRIRRSPPAFTAPDRAPGEKKRPGPPR